MDEDNVVETVNVLVKTIGVMLAIQDLQNSQMARLEDAIRALEVTLTQRS